MGSYPTVRFAPSNLPPSSWSDFRRKANCTHSHSTLPRNMYDWVRGFLRVSCRVSRLSSQPWSRSKLQHNSISPAPMVWSPTIARARVTRPRTLTTISTVVRWGLELTLQGLIRSPFPPSATQIGSVSGYILNVALFHRSAHDEVEPTATSLPIRLTFTAPFNRCMRHLIRLACRVLELGQLIVEYLHGSSCLVSEPDVLLS